MHQKLFQQPLKCECENMQGVKEGQTPNHWPHHDPHHGGGVAIVSCVVAKQRIRRGAFADRIRRGDSLS